MTCPVRGLGPICLSMPRTLVISPIGDSLPGHVTNALSTSAQPIRKQARADHALSTRYVTTSTWDTSESQRSRAYTTGVGVSRSSHWTLTHPPPNKHSRPLPILTDQMFKHGRQFNQWTLLSLGWGSEGIVTLLYSQQQGRGGSSGRGNVRQMA